MRNRFAILIALLIFSLVPPALAQAPGPADARMARSVTLYRDTYGVPHIFGPTDAACVFGLSVCRELSDGNARARSAKGGDGFLHAFHVDDREEQHRFAICFLAGSLRCQLVLGDFDQNQVRHVLAEVGVFKGGPVERLCLPFRHGNQFRGSPQLLGPDGPPLLLE
jgi:hypothetical protein